MADKRINALANTAPSTASDDFIAVDGTTNGTRKLNAFSPTFGGNATVTGTLTVNGDTESIGSSASSGTTLKVISGVGTLASPKYSSLAFRTYNDSDTGAYIRTGNRQADTNEWLLEVATRSNANVLTHIATFSDSKLSVLATTASTTTSSGALVVGNGTSGGLGVGGSVVLGANLVSTASDGKFQITGTGNTTGNKEISLQRSDAADSFAIGLTGSAYAGALTGLGNNEAFIYNSSASAFRIFLGTASTNRFDFTSSQFKINPTTASTTTSSGALVVSGGVGVAGAIYAGGALFTVSGAGFNTPDWRFYQSGTSGYIRDLVNGQMALQFVSGNASTIQVYATGTQDSTSTTSGALVSSGGLGVAGAVNAGTFYGLVDGVPAPATAGGYARIYVDSADGDLKVKFGDGTVKTIATDS